MEFSLEDNRFTTLIGDIIEDKTLNNYDNNQYENIIDMQCFNQNVFSNLNKLFKDEYERIYDNYSVNKIIDNITEKIKNDIKDINIEYDSESFLKECKTTNNKENETIKNNLKLDLNLDKFKNDITTLRNYYCKINIETFKLENEIIKVLKNYDTYHSKIKTIYTQLNDFENIDEYMKVIDDVIITYINKHFKKHNLDEKIKIYKNNIKEINFIKKYINEINSINFVPYCTICMTKIVDSVIIPCGHTACNDCLLKCDMKCFICRNNINNITKLFIN